MSTSTTIKKLLKTIFGIAIICWIIASINASYIAPDHFIGICFTILLPLFVVISYWVMFSKIFQPTYFQRLQLSLQKRSQNAIANNIYAYLAPLVIAMVVLFFVLKFPVLPTKALAETPFEQRATVYYISCQNSTIPFQNSSEITFKSPLSIGQSSLVFPDALCSRISNYKSLYGKEIVLHGRKWLLGKYVDVLEYPNPSYKEPNTEDLIRDTRLLLMNNKTTKPITVPNPLNSTSPVRNPPQHN